MNQRFVKDDDSETKRKEILYKMMNMYDKDRPIYNPNFNQINNDCPLIVTDLDIDTSYSGKLSYIIDSIID